MNDLEQRIEQLAEKVKENPSRKMWQFSENFWERLKIKRRTSTGVKHIEDSFAKFGIRIVVENHGFGIEPKDAKVHLQYLPIPIPSDTWFEKMTKKVFENEQEVNVFFLSPLFLNLGYQEEDFSFEYPVDISPKASRKKKVDLVLFNGTDRSPENALVLCEAKRPESERTQSKQSNLELADQESKLYSIGLKYVKRRVATNGDTLRVYKGQEQQEPFMEINRSEFQNKWYQLYFCLGKSVLCLEN